MYLGSNHVLSQMSRTDLDQRLQTIVPLIFGERDSKETPVDSDAESSKSQDTKNSSKLQGANNHPAPKLQSTGAGAAKTKSTVAGLRYDMCDFIRQCIDRYLELTGTDTRIN